MTTRICSGCRPTPQRRNDKDQSCRRCAPISSHRLDAVTNQDAPKKSSNISRFQASNGCAMRGNHSCSLPFGVDRVECAGANGVVFLQCFAHRAPHAGEIDFVRRHREARRHDFCRCGFEDGIRLAHLLEKSRRGGNGYPNQMAIAARRDRRRNPMAAAKKTSARRGHDLWLRK